MFSCTSKEITIMADFDEAGRISYGCDRLEQALMDKGYTVTVADKPGPVKGKTITVGELDSEYMIDDFILEHGSELEGLTGIRFDYNELLVKLVKYIIDLKEDACILMAYFNSNEPWYLMKPALETDAEADVRGSAEPVLRHAMTLNNHPGVNIHMVKYEKGLHEIVPGQGGFFIAGIIKQDNRILPRDAFIGQNRTESLQWLFAIVPKSLWIFTYTALKQGFSQQNIPLI